MKRSFYEKAKSFFINMGKHHKFLRVVAIIGLAASMLTHRVCLYFKTGMKRFACTAFVLLCFMVGNSFAYPVFQEETGFISGEEKETEVVAIGDSDISLADERQVEYENLKVLDDDDVVDGYSDRQFHDMENVDKYFLDEILEEKESTGSESPETLKQEETGAEQKILTTEAPQFDAEDWRLVLINKQHPIPEDYSFSLGMIKTIKGDMECDERIIEDLLQMMQAASEDGVTLAICSPYRDLSYQEYLFNRKIRAYMKKGMSYMEAYSKSSQAVTVPGASEHQIGLAIDIISDTYLTLDEGFAETSAGIWLSQHCAEYGFILRYPKGKEAITSIEFEPWHFRYVGKDAAEVIMDEGLCLEEFWDKYL